MEEQHQVMTVRDLAIESVAWNYKEPFELEVGKTHPWGWEFYMLGPGRETLCGAGPILVQQEDQSVHRLGSGDFVRDPNCVSGFPARCVCRSCKFLNLSWEPENFTHAFQERDHEQLLRSIPDKPLCLSALLVFYFQKKDMTRARSTALELYEWQEQTDPNDLVAVGNALSHLIAVGLHLPDPELAKTAATEHRDCKQRWFAKNKERLRQLGHTLAEQRHFGLCFD